MLTKRKAQVNAEKRASGINVELTDLKVMLDEIKDDIEKCQETIFSETEQKRLADLQEKQKSEEVRKTAMETLGNTRRRKCGNGSEEEVFSPPKEEKRRSGSETLRFLCEKNKQAKKEHDDNTKLRAEELALRKEKIKNL